MRLVERLARALVPHVQRALNVPSPSQFVSFPWGGSYGEDLPGGWQRNLSPASTDNPTRFSAVYRCIALISGDIAKLRPMLMEEQADGTKREVRAAAASPYLSVLRKPNGFQTWQQFAEDWLRSKLIAGNAYVLVERDNRGGDGRGVPVAMYVLDPLNVRVYISDAGDVFYGLGKDPLAGVTHEDVVVPASEIIHDRGICLWHPLVGVSPLYAAALAAQQGRAIQSNSQQFFANMSRPSGLLVSPQKIAADQAAELKRQWDEGFSGTKLGKIAVLSGGLDYKPMVIPPADAQLAEQMQLSVGDVARAFGVPPYKLGLQTNVTFSNAGQLNQDYYSQTLQTPIFAMQALLREGLRLPADYRVWLNLDGLLIMDPAGQADADAKELGSGALAPNEARLKRNRPPVKGGEVPFMQQQMFQISALADRAPPQDVPKLPVPVEEAPSENDEAREREEARAAEVAELRAKVDTQSSAVQSLEARIQQLMMTQSGEAQAAAFAGSLIERLRRSAHV
jgi:HK97 family phage portal protein